MTREVGIGDAERPRRKHPALELRVAMQIAQALQRVSAALRRTLGHGGRGGYLRQNECPSLFAECLPYGDRLFYRLSVPQLALLLCGFGDRGLPRCGWSLA